MKSNEIKIIVLEIILLATLIISYLVNNNINEYYISAVIGVVFLISIKLIGFEKHRSLNKKTITKLITFFTIAFLIMLYGIGLFSGYLRNVYSLSFKLMIKNTLPTLVLIISTELCRYNFCKKGKDNKFILIFSTILFIAVDTISSLFLYDLSTNTGMIKLITIIVIPSITKNIMLTDFTFKYGIECCLIYRIIMELYVFLIPIVPDLSLYLQSVIFFLIPILLYIIINWQFSERESGIYTTKLNKVFTSILVLIMIIMICLNSNLFSIWIAAIGSGSMTPTIEIGDAVVIDKTVQDNIEELKVGDVLVFKINQIIYTHRIIDIDYINGKYSITTQGDREGQPVDSWKVTDEDIIGRVIFKIKYIGYPTVWLNDFLKD